jgi:hypothetical protein
MAVEVKLDAIIEALESLDDSISSYLDLETGEVHSITEEEFDLVEDVPDWQREAVVLARDIQQHEGKRYLALPNKFDVHEWDIMDRFSQSLRNTHLRNDFHGAIYGAGAFRLFKRLLAEYNLWDAWNRFKQIELRRIAKQWCEENGIDFRETQL